MTLAAPPQLVALPASRRGSVVLNRFLPVVALGLDLAVVCLALVLALVARQYGYLFSEPAGLTVQPSLLAPLVAATWVAALVTRGSYARYLFGAGPEEFKRVLSAGMLTAGIVGVVSYLTHVELSREFFVAFFVVGIPGTIGGRLALRHSIQTARRRGVLQRRVLLVGGLLYVDEIASVLARESWLGLNVVGALAPGGSVTHATPGGVVVLGDSVDHVSATLAEHEIDVVFFASGAHASAAKVREVVWELEGSNVSIVVAPGVTDISSERIRVHPVGGLPLLHLTPPTWSDASRWGKRTFDFLGALACLVVLSPLLAVVAAWVKLHDGGPVLFRQPRVGRHGLSFSCLKFRSMVTDAELMLPDLTSDGGEDSLLFKMRDDPRVTRPGRVIRRFSLDELPQLINVLRGEMSLVGPRPPLATEVSRYEGHTARRLHVRPGITGLWQVSGRSDLSWEEAVRLDLYYVDNWSMLQDLNIMLKTVRAVLSSRGAY